MKTAMPQSVSERIHQRLSAPVKTRDDLLGLFVKTLGYSFVEEQIPARRDTFGDGIALDFARRCTLLRLAEHGSFQILCIEMDGDQLDYFRQRVLATKLLESFPDALFVFVRRGTLGAAAGAEIHLLNVKAADRRVFRRFKLGAGERYRTTAERLALLHVEDAALDASALRAKHDAAFDVEPITKKFFADFCEVFAKVARDIREHNAGWDKDTVEKETQTLLNRLLFLYFIQRKGWLNRERDYLYSRFRQHSEGEPDGDSYHRRFLHPLFIRLSTSADEAASALGDVPFLNGGLFDDEYGGQQRQEKLLRRTRMKVSNRVLQRVFEDLLEKYNFTVREDTPLNQDVAIDPEMLGKIFESLVLQLEQSDTGGKTSRHDTGSYYTPRPIVHYLCREALRVWLESNCGMRQAETLLALDASDGIGPDERAILDGCLSTDEARRIGDALDDLRACDPAVGSGAFPVGLLHELVNFSRLCETRSRGRDPVETDSDWLYNTKSRFIQRVIYGVDLQERAIEICKLRLWLSMMVDLDIGVDVDDCSQAAFRSALKKKVTPLPNLDFKIRRANSLIDQIHGEPVNFARIDAADKTLPPILNRLTSAKLEFYSAHSLTEKRRLRFDILDATAQLAMVEFQREKLAHGLGFVVSERDKADAARQAELQRAERYMAQIRAEIVSARKGKAHEQDDALERLSRRLDDPEKPTFVWQLDFAEVFHRPAPGSARASRAGEGAPAFADFAEAAPPGVAPGSPFPRGAETSTRGACAPQASGFDIIVANPPYVRQERIKELKPDLQRVYECYTGVADLFVYFYERGIRLLREGGVLSFISSNKFFRAGYGEKLRRFLRKNTRLHTLVDFGDLPIFEATAYPCIVIAQRGEAPPDASARTLNVRSMEELERFTELAATAAVPLVQKEFGGDGWRLESHSTLRLLEKLRRAGKPLGDYVGGRFYYGIKTGLNEAFVVDRATRDRLIREHKSSAEVLKPFLRGRDVKRWRVESQDLWLIFTRRGIEIKNHPAILEHLSQFKKQLMPGAPGGRKPGSYEWFEIQDNVAYWQEFEQPKIVYPDIAKHCEFAIDAQGGYPDCTLFLIPEGSMHLLAILNSSPTRFFFPNICPRIRGDFMRFKSIYMWDIPIPDAPAPERPAISKLVQKCLDARGEGVADFEAELNERVARLYGLTREEMKIINDAAK